MTTENNAPYTWEEIEKQVRTAVLRQLNSLIYFGPQDEAIARAFAGVDPELFDPWLDSDRASNADQTFPVERHGIYTVSRQAYAYAYQTDAWFSATEETYHLACALLDGAYALADTDGELSPLAKLNDPPLRRMLETFVARWKLSNEEYRSGLTVRELALLSNMTVPAVRTSLSKEGFKLEANYRTDAAKDENGVLSEEDAVVWLSRRRGFVPTRTDSPRGSSGLTTTAAVQQWLETLSFTAALQRILASNETDASSLAAKLDLDPVWLTNLAAGKAVALNVDGLRQLSRHLGADEAVFVSKAVHHLITVEMQGAAA
ncbi:hypothetical protein [Fuscovulum ytuae]|uniref:Uncharacterized protein n=1 Tax=Fuscovulum ytuae TaxID=3042299 RepID=A0ABY8Q5Q5_9RHOB|nr:hypothetical protein [Fuscovulum sp. YMD61]WGV16009.1 hypothetical protein QF092_17420 [Fuscovulum sp. YMD61]